MYIQRLDDFAFKSFVGAIGILVSSSLLPAIRKRSRATSAPAIGMSCDGRTRMIRRHIFARNAIRAESITSTNPQQLSAWAWNSRSSLFVILGVLCG